MFRDELSSVLEQGGFDSVIEAPQELVEGRKRLAEVLGSIREIESELERLDELDLRKTIPLERFTSRDQALQEKLRQFQAESETLKAEVKRLEKSRESSDSGARRPDPIRAAEAWNSLSQRDKGRLARQMIDKVVVGDGSLHFHYRFNPSVKEAAQTRQAPSPTLEPAPAAGPEDGYIRLPKPGTKCPWSGLGKSTLNELILASKKNGFRPPVQSLHKRLPGRKQGVRLINWPSLKAYLEQK